MKLTVYLTSDEVLEIHALLVRETGGSAGLRDRGLLESALHRPQTGYYDSIFDQAAALFELLVLNHVFVDGNKRIAITVAGVFLRTNGYELKISADEGEKFILVSVIEKRISISEISEWFKGHSLKVDSEN